MHDVTPGWLMGMSSIWPLWRFKIRKIQKEIKKKDLASDLGISFLDKIKR